MQARDVTVIEEEGDHLFVDEEGNDRAEQTIYLLINVHHSITKSVGAPSVALKKEQTLKKNKNRSG